MKLTIRLSFIEPAAKQEDSSDVDADDHSDTNAPTQVKYELQQSTEQDGDHDHDVRVKQEIKGQSEHLTDAGNHATDHDDDGGGGGGNAGDAGDDTMAADDRDLQHLKQEEIDIEVADQESGEEDPFQRHFSKDITPIQIQAIDQEKPSVFQPVRLIL